MKRILLVFTALVTLLMTGLVRADEVEYRIESYKGNLVLQDNGHATFTQEVTYYFDSSYNGQYVTLGAADPVPKGYAIDGRPNVKATVNGIAKDVSYIEEDLTDGKQLKVYNAGDSGDRVVLTVTWQIHHILSYYSDIAELNWFPISDWDEAINNVEFTIEGLDASQGQLVAHRGFFNDEVSVERTANGYYFKIDRISSGGKLELHAFWPMTDSLRQENSEYLIDTNHKDSFLHQEETIVVNRARYRFLVYGLVPIIILVLLILSVALIIVFFKSTSVPGLIKRARLYDIPQDLAPLVLAKNIYKQEFDATGLGQEKGELTFNHMVEATILDLIDRGNLKYDAESGNPTLSIIKDDNLDDFEKDFLYMLFDQTSVVDESQMFSKYQIDEKALRKAFNKAKSQKERNRLKNVGNDVRRLFRKDAGSVTQAVAHKERSLDLPNHFRQLTKGERHVLRMSGFSYGLAIILIIASMFFLVLGFNAVLPAMAYLISGIFLLAIGMGVSYLVKRRQNYCLDKEHLDTYNQWRSFENMIGSIDQFKQAELESVTVWNRILVYAILYGQAKRVSKVLKKYDIHLANETLDDYVYSPAHFILLQQSSSLQSYVAASETVSHFSTSSNSGSGGFSGGGFSGGGGGGGGGAF